jgi:uncharacterized protein
MRIIDCHAHFGYFAQTKIACPDASSMLRAMDRTGVEIVCLSSFLSIGPDCRMGNRLLAAAVAEHPDRLAGYAAINPNRPGEIVDELDRCFHEYSFRAIKIHPAFHRYAVDGSAYRKTLEYADRNRLTVLSHEWGSPALLERLSGEYPNVNFILAHTGFWDGRADFAYAGVLTRSANVYVDLVYSNIYYESLERMVTQVGAEKILWGADFPLHDLGYQLGRLLFSKLDDAAKEQILGGTMSGLLGL